MQWVYLKGYKTGWLLFEQGGAGLCAGGMYQERDCASGWWEPPRGPERPPKSGWPRTPIYYTTQVYCANLVLVR